MNLSFCIFRRRAGLERWTLLSAHGHHLTRMGRNPSKLGQDFREALRKLLKETPAHQVRSFERAPGMRLEYVRLDLSLRGDGGRRAIAGRFPVVLEPRPVGGERILTLAYHPERKQDWFVVADGEELSSQATRFFQNAWSELDEWDLEDLPSSGREQLHTISITGSPKEPSVQKKQRKRVGLGGQRPTVLSTIAVDRTEALENKSSEQLGLSRQPYRGQLASLLCGARKQSALVIGESGSGKSALLDQAVYDLLQADDYPSHRNIDSVHHVYQLSGRQLIASMSYLGEWEQRCFDLFEEVKKKRAIVWITDLAVFGRTGRSRESSRSLADVFRGPIARSELTVIADVTPSELAQLEQDAPDLVALFTPVKLAPASTDETLRMLLAESRRIELERQVAFTPDALLRLLELADTLVTGRALPGAALDWLPRVVSNKPQRHLDSGQVLEFVAAHTGLRRVLFDHKQPLTASEVQSALEQRVLGQNDVIARVVDMVLRVKTGLTDPRRPYGVFLFTGPTGTGKTELAKALAEYMYGSQERLVRFDMGEYTSSDAVPRLIGEIDGPEGVLTRTLEEQPFCVLLLDELEKAHASVFPLLLQLLDEGRLTGADGRVASFRNAVIVMTSNLGARARKASGFGAESSAREADTMRAVREFFAPELINRIDEILSFAPLKLEHARIIVERELSRLCARPGLRDRNAIVLTDSAAIDRIAEAAFQAQDGARSLRRFLEDRIASVLADTIATSPDAALRIVHLHDRQGEFGVEEHQLKEAPALAAHFALEKLAGKSRRELWQRLPETSRLLDAVEESPALPALAERIRVGLSEHVAARKSGGAELYSLEWLRLELARLRDELTRMSSTTAERVAEEAEQREDFVVIPGGEEQASSLEPVRTRGETRTVLSHQELSTTLARVYYLRRALARVHLDEQHSVEIELTPIALSRHTGSRLLTWLAHAYGRAQGELDCYAAALPEAVLTGEDVAELEAQTLDHAACVVLHVVGPAVRDFFEPEEGMHVLVSTTRDIELVRVRVRPLNNAVSAAARATALRDELTHGTPHALFATHLTRLIRFEAPREGASAVLEIEDHPHAYVASQHVQTLGQALESLWLLRASREDYQS